jgi:profilin
MSWQTYIDDHLMVELPHGGQLESAAILGLDGGVWAQSSNFPELSEPEVEALVKGFEGKAGSDALAQSGIRLGGNKYMAIAGEEGQVHRGKKGAGGVTVKKTNTAMVVGIYGEGVQPADCTTIVENMGDYLSGQGI